MGANVSRPGPEVEARLRAGVDAACAEAAVLLSQADVFFLTTGAGFSADSGLAIYADVAKVEAYASRELDYHDLCQPHWLDEEPELFWGFWGQCYNDYRRTAPHAGYEMIDRWAEKHFRHSKVASELRAHQAASAKTGPLAEYGEQPYTVDDHAGAFFVFTSNVDAHHFDWFRACEIRECHGNTEQYQCSTRACSSNVWRAPPDFRFEVSKETMLAPAMAAAAAVDPAQTGGGAVASAVPRIGDVGGEARTTTLRNMPGTPPAAGAPGWQTNHPTCPKCNSPARPAILMFSDGMFKDLDPQEDRWEAWSEAVELQAIDKAKAESALRVVILEIGAGGNVTTIRSRSEMCLERWSDEFGADVKLVRVNPDYPCGDGCKFTPEASEASKVVSIMSRGLESIRKIDAAVTAMDSQQQRA